MKRFAIFMIRFYQKYISGLKRHPSCRFSPTCSAYALEAFQKRGFWAGLILSLYRLLRCQPLCAGGYDPVPDTGFQRQNKPVKRFVFDSSRFDPLKQQ
ncbi:MAG: membrane protein insertion efficiency factor YidD [Clostridia bacterium]|nr:membrane protein insertion efficiency factor YidD [Clostridia bacterium]MBQ3927047.1 membrane protein insertion efficiency factor YidD [Clostridia bacterium]